MDVSRETSGTQVPDVEWFESRILDGAAALHVGLPRAAARALAVHLRRVLEENRRQNLTAIRDPADAVRLHVVDSLAFLCADETVIDPVADIGAGAGYPGIPIAAAGGAKCSLLESNSKKARFLETVVEEIGLRGLISVCPVRAEEHAIESRAAYRTAVARAVAGLPSLVELAAPLLEMGGRFVAMKGSPAAEELDAGRAAAEIVGLQEILVKRLVLPGGDERRTLVVYRKAREPSIDLPRRTGLAQKRPLA